MKRKSPLSRYQKILLGLVAFGSICGFQSLGLVQAATCSRVFIGNQTQEYNRCLFYGYYTNVDFFPLGSLTFLIYGGLNGVTDGSSFISHIQSPLFTDISGCPAPGTDNGPDSFNPASCSFKVHNVIGAATVVNTMLGHNGTDFTGVVDGITQAKNSYNEWQTIVQFYAAQPLGSPNGWVEWSTQHVHDPADIDGVGDNHSRDAYFAIGTGGGIQDVVIFHNPDGTVFTLIKQCSNPTGLLSPLRPASFQMNPGVNGIAQTPAIGQPTRLDVNTYVDASMTKGSLPPAGLPAKVTRDIYWQRGGIKQGDLAVKVDNTNIQTHSTFTDTINSGLPAFQNGDEYCVIVTVDPGSGDLDFSNNEVNKGPPASSSPSCQIVTIATRPYLQSFGGDVRAGGGFAGGDCAQASKILTFNNNPSGSGSQFVAQASDQITGFASALMNLTANPPVNLTLANFGVNTIFPELGGDFGGSHCITDYWATTMPSGLSQAVPNLSSATLPNIAATTNVPNVYRFKSRGSTPLKLSGSINPGQRMVIYVDGDVFINNNIVYAGGNSWASITDIPSFNLIAKGNIYIDGKVTQLDGNYIAEPDDLLTPTNGRIYTCVDNGITPPYYALPTSSDYYDTSIPNTCTKQLTVNGSFIAQQVKLLRTFGTVENAQAGESPTTPVHGCGTGFVAKSTCSAEVFNFSPDVFFTNPPFNPTIDSNAGRYDAISNLQPVL